MNDSHQHTEQQQQTIIQQLQGQLQSEKRLAQLFHSAPEQAIDTLLQKLPDAQPQEHNSDVMDVGIKVEGLLDYAYSRGVHHFVQQLDNDMLTRVFADLSSAENGGKQKKWPEGKKISRDSLLDVFELFGFDMLRDLKLKTLRQLVKMLQFDTDAQSVLEYALDIADEILLNGAREVMQELTLDQLKSFCRILGYRISGSKVELMDRLLNMAFPGILDEEEQKSLLRRAPQDVKRSKKESKAKREKVSESDVESAKEGPSSKKQKTESEEKIELKPKLLTKEQAQEIRPPIAKGITKFDLTQFYWQDEIQAYCREHGINAAGNKRAQIQRVLDYLDNPENKGYKKKGGRGRGRRKATVETTTTNTATTASQGDKEQEGQDAPKEDIGST